MQVGNLVKADARIEDRSGQEEVPNSWGEFSPEKSSRGPDRRKPERQALEDPTARIPEPRDGPVTDEVTTEKETHRRCRAPFYSA